MAKCNRCGRPIAFNYSIRKETYYPVNPKTGRLHICPGLHRRHRAEQAQTQQHLKAITTEQ